MTSNTVSKFVPGHTPHPVDANIEKHFDYLFQIPHSVEQEDLFWKFSGSNPGKSIFLSFKKCNSWVQILQLHKNFSINNLCVSNFSIIQHQKLTATIKCKKGTYSTVWNVALFAPEIFAVYYLLSNNLHVVWLLKMPCI